MSFGRLHLRDNFRRFLHRAGQFRSGALQGKGRDAFVAIVPVNKEAGDAPVWKFGKILLIVLLELDVWEFVGWAKLAPADRLRSVVHEGGVCVAFADASARFWDRCGG